MSFVNEVVDLVGPYIPRLHQMVHDFGCKVRERDKKGGSRLREKGCRLKHRPDIRRYVDTDGIVDGVIVNPSFVNPCKAEGGINRNAVDALWHIMNVEFLDGIVGVFNETPVLSFCGLEKFVNTEKCFYRETGCPHNTGDCKCIWRPFQLIHWGRRVDDKIVFLSETEVYSTPWISSFQLRDLIRSRLGKSKWEDFLWREYSKQELEEIERAESEVALEDSQKKGTYDSIHLNSSHEKKVELLEEIAATRIASNLQTFQRVDLHTSNPYGCPFLQCGLAIDSCYADDHNTMLFRLTLNQRIPDVKSKRYKGPAPSVKKMVLD